jgi:hypothetical protein
MNTDTHRYCAAGARARFIRVYPCLSVVALSISLLAGCAELRWHKDGADAAALERDLAECRQQAQARAERLSTPKSGTGPRVVGVDGKGRAVISQPGQIDTGQFVAEHDLTRHCMGQKGWKLVPAEEQ